MTLPITEFTVYLAENNASSDLSTGIVILVSAVIFIAATALGGILSYKIKLNDLRKKSAEEKSAENDKEG
ncbi:MAG: hypothetical protein J6B75_06030 [Ruminococcus sp.]|nr:hypothetical protein [Ruminococcus sp.]